MATVSKYGDLALSWSYGSEETKKGFGVALTYMPGDESQMAVGDVTINKTSSSTDITVDIPTKFENDELTVPITGPAFIDAKLLSDKVAEKFAITDNPAGCTVKSVLVSGTLSESSLRINIKQSTDECPDGKVGDTFSTFWSAFAQAAAEGFDGAAPLVEVKKLGCHQPNGTVKTCYAGFKVPANVDESTDAFIKLFKASDTVTSATPKGVGSIRKAGSALATLSTATCTFSWDTTALQYKVTYTNKGNDDDAICIFMVADSKAKAVTDYTYAETDAIILTKANKSYTEDDVAGKLALSSGYVNSSWSILTIILIVGGLLIIVVLGLFWWFRPTQVESEEEE